MIFGPSGSFRDPQKPLFLILGPPSYSKQVKKMPETFLGNNTFGNFRISTIAVFGNDARRTILEIRLLNS